MDEEVKQLNVIQRLAGIIFNPGKVFQDINRKPALIMPIVFILTLNVIITLIMLPKTLEYTFSLMKKMQAMPAGMEVILKVQVIVGGIVGAVLTPVLLWLALAVIIKFITVFTGDDGSFKNLFAVNIYAYLPVLIGNLVKAITMAFIKTDNLRNIQTSLALFLPKPENISKPGALYTFLSQLDLFTIWSFILITMGVAVVLKISNKKSAIMVFGIFFAFISLFTGLAAVLSKLPTPGL